MPTPRLSRESSSAASPLKLGALSSENRGSLGKLDSTAGAATDGAASAPKLPAMPALRTENMNPALQTPPRASMVAKRSMINSVMPGGPPSPPIAPHPLLQGSVQPTQTNSAGGMRLPQMTPRSASSFRAASPPPLFPKRTSIAAGSSSGTHTPPVSAAAIAGKLQFGMSSVGAYLHYCVDLIQVTLSSTDILRCGCHCVLCISC
jgi:hypothetical protein